MELLEAGDLNDPNLLLGKFFEIAEKVEGKPRIVGPIKPAGSLYQDERGFLYTRGLFFEDKLVGKYFMADRPDRDLLKEVPPPKGK